LVKLLQGSGTYEITTDFVAWEASLFDHYDPKASA